MRNIGFPKINVTQERLKNLPQKRYSREKMELMENNVLKFSKLAGAEKGKSIIICGCGTSINDFIPDDKNTLFGVNDIQRKFWTKYLICVNEPFTFKRGRYQWIQTHTAEKLFTHLSTLPVDRGETLVFINLGKRDGVDIDNIGKIDFTANSPYMAVIIAYQLGASKIGMIGVDMTNDHFFDKTGEHLLTKKHEIVNSEYRKLGEALISRGVKIANLSPISQIKSWPYMTLEDFNKY